MERKDLSKNVNEYKNGSDFCKNGTNRDEKCDEEGDSETFRYSDGSVRLRNPNIELMDQDILYHLALGSGSHDLQEMFGDVKVSVIFKKKNVLCIFPYQLLIPIEFP
uniref:Uncharacterized protein n=1 Tax=Phlebotomus papatasi TaxID=29031 RepID=A0A1B0DJB8_PHLPP